MDREIKISYKNIFGLMLLCILSIVIISHSQLPLLLFKGLEYRYKAEVKEIIKNGVAEEELIQFTFHKDILTEPAAGFEWKKENEFRYDGEMYDITKREIKGDSITFYCIHDFKESKLFTNLDKYVYEYINGDTEKKSNIKAIFQLISYYYTPTGYFFPENHTYPREMIFDDFLVALTEGVTIDNDPPPQQV